MLQRIIFSGIKCTKKTILVVHLGLNDTIMESTSKLECIRCGLQFFLSFLNPNLRDRYCLIIIELFMVVVLEIDTQGFPQVPTCGFPKFLLSYP